MADDAARAWAAELRALLGLREVQAAPDEGTTDPGSWDAAKHNWLAACETVDAQLNALHASLRASRHPTLLRVAEYGLNGVTGKLKVTLQAALLDFERSGEDGRAKVSKRLLGAITGYKAFVASNLAVELMDDNPLGVQVTIRKTLHGALERLEAAVGERASW